MASGLYLLTSELSNRFDFYRSFMPFGGYIATTKTRQVNRITIKLNNNLMATYSTVTSLSHLIKHCGNVLYHYLHQNSLSVLKRFIRTLKVTRTLHPTQIVSYFSFFRGTLWANVNILRLIGGLRLSSHGSPVRHSLLRGHFPRRFNSTMSLLTK